MDPDRKPFSTGTNLGHEQNLVDTEPQPSNVNHGTVTSSSTSLSRSGTSVQSNRGTYSQLHPHGPQRYNYDHRDHTGQDQHQFHLESSTTPSTWTRSTSYSGSLSPPEAHASGLDPAGAPPIGTTKPSHRNPYQYLQSHPHLLPPNPRRSSSGSLSQESGGDPPFSPPFLHPLSSPTNYSRTPSPLPSSTRRSRDRQKLRTRFTVGSSPPNSPMEAEPKRGRAPATFPSPFSIRGFLALSTFEKIVAVLFVCCVFVLARAFFGVGHTAEKCGVCAHEMTDAGSMSRSYGVGSDPSPKSRSKDGLLLDRRGEDGQSPVWLERVEEMYEYRYDWGMGDYEVEHDDNGDDRYDDEYEHDDFSDLV